MDTPHEEHLIIFTRYPRPGEVKTRLIPALGAKGAADLHRTLTERMVARGRTLARRRPVQLHIFFTGADMSLMERWLGRTATYHRQQGATLGERMALALETLLEAGARRILLVGSDCPFLDPDLLAGALDKLHHRDTVLGPAVDGGYYLIGIRQGIEILALRHLFEDVPWGSSQVFARTMERIREAGLNCSLLPSYRDIDRPDDLVHLHHHPGVQ
ncbi:TIGR04282 family arsenosugar biosynthesis glycosyltransferase [Desulfolithobacter sp.]